MKNKNSALSVQIVGSGNVATHVAKKLYAKGVKIDFIYSPNFENAEKLAQSVHAKAAKDISSMLQKVVDFVLICTPDDYLTETIQKFLPSHAFIIHFSGAKGLDVFGEHSKGGIIYPLQTFSKEVAVEWEKTPLFLLQKQAGERGQIESLAHLLSPNMQWISAEDKIVLHLAAVMVCNFPNFLYGLAHEILQEKHIPFGLFKPLMQQTLDKALLATSPFAVQTGPARRGDLHTLQTHQNVLKDHPSILEIYSYLSDKIKNYYASK